MCHGTLWPGAAFRAAPIDALDKCLARELNVAANRTRNERWLGWGIPSVVGVNGDPRFKQIVDNARRRRIHQVVVRTDPLWRTRVLDQVFQQVSPVEGRYGLAYCDG